MIKRCLLTGLILWGGSLAARAEVMRPLFSKENRFPGKHRFEVGTLFKYTELTDFHESLNDTDVDETSIGPYLRFGVTDNFATFVVVPYNEVEPDVGKSESGLGDIAVGFEYLAYEDIFHYPWVIPHVQLNLDTGDEDDGLGAGETSTVLGLSVGSRAWDVCHFIIDGSYQVFEDSENIARISGAIIWDVSERFAVLAEARGTDEDLGGDKEHPAVFLGGLSFQPNEDFILILYGGGGKNTREDVIIAAKAALTF
jgi:hypothetical protein